MLPICAKCSTQFKILREGEYIVKWAGKPATPVEIRTADLVYCPKCGQRIYTNCSLDTLADLDDRDALEKLYQDIWSTACLWEEN